jgi:hypothetical protein
MYPTPSATPYGSSQNEGKVEHKPSNGTPSLASWASSLELWPTPTAGDSKASGGRNQSNAKEGSRTHTGTSLTDATVRGQRWNTPLARDGKGRRGGKRADRYPGLPAQAGLRKGNGMVLNPQFVEMLMGLPIGWTDCDA